MLSSIKRGYQKFYFPGIISLVVFPLLCIGYLFYAGKFKRYSMITITMPAPGDLDTTHNSNSKQFWKLPNRKYMSSVLTGEQNHDSRIMMAFEHNVKMTHFRHDTVTGYKLIFTTHTKYSSMIAAIDICENLQSSVDRPEWLVYIPYGDSFYAAEYVEPNRRNVVSIYAVPCLLCNDVIVPKPESPSGLLLIAKEVVKDFELIVPFWPSVILLFIMLRLALRSEWMERKIYA